MTAPYSPGDMPTWDDEYHDMSRTEYWALVAQRCTQIDEDNAAGRLDDQMLAWSHRQAAHTSPKALREEVNHWTPAELADQARWSSALAGGNDAAFDDLTPLPHEVAQRARQLYGTGQYLTYTDAHRAAYDQQSAEAMRRAGYATDWLGSDGPPPAEHPYTAPGQTGQARAQRQRHVEGRVLAAEAELHPDDMSITAEQTRATAASIRDHREMDHQRLQWAAAEGTDPPRLTQQEAVETTTQHRDVGDEPHVQRYAQHLLDRYDTITGLETVHGRGSANPDAVVEVVEEMRRFVASVPPAAVEEPDPTDVADEQTHQRFLGDDDPATMSEDDFARWSAMQDDRRAQLYAEQQRDAYLDHHEARDVEALDRRVLERAATTSSAQLRCQAALDRLDPGRRPLATDSFEPAYSRGPGRAAVGEVDDDQLAR